MIEPAASPRRILLDCGLRLEYLTVGWNLIEGAAGLIAAIPAGSVALLAFGIQSFVESASGLLLVWRLRSERAGVDPEALERVERRAGRLVAASLVGLAVFVVVDGLWTLARGVRPDRSPLGIVVTAAAIVVMARLSRAKRKTARALGSRAMQADAFQSSACFWLSLTALVGVALNAAFGLWWADPAAALAITYFLGREALESWRGEDCCEV